MADDNTFTMETPDGKQYSVPREQVQNMRDRFQAKIVGDIGQGAFRVRPWERTLVSRTGFDPEKIAAAGGTGAQWAETGREALSGLEGIPGWLISILKDPLHMADPVANPLNQLGKDTPGIDPRKWNIPGAVGDISAAAGGTEFMRDVAIPGTEFAINRPIRRGAQVMSGVGKGVVKQAQKSALKEAGAGIAERGTEAVERSAKETGAAVKSATEGPVYQRVQAATNRAVDEVNNLDKEVRAREDVKWDRFRQTVGDPVIDSTGPAKAITAARDALRTPEDQAHFDRVISAAEKEAEEVSARSLSTKEAALANYVNDILKSTKMSLKELRAHLPNLGYTPHEIEHVLKTFPQFAEEEGKVPFNVARARYTKLGEKLQGLDGSVRRAVNQVQDAYDQSIRQPLNEAQNRIYTGLKQSWSQYLGDFYDSDGPFYKLKNAASTADRIATLAGKWGKEMMDRAGRYGYKPTTIRIVRDLNGQIEALPSSTPKPPQTGPRIPGPRPGESGEEFASREFTSRGERKNLPSREALAELRKRMNPEQIRRDILEGRAPSGINPSFMMKWQMLRYLRDKLASLEPVKDYLSKEPK